MYSDHTPYYAYFFLQKCTQELRGKVDWYFQILFLDFNVQWYVLDYSYAFLMYNLV